MTPLEEYLRSELHALVDDEQPPESVLEVPAAARRRRRIRAAVAACATAAVVAATIVVVTAAVGAGSGRRAPAAEKPPSSAAVTSSYFPAERPPLPPRVTIRQVTHPAGHVIPRERIIASWRAFFADPRYRYAKGTPTDTIATLRTADLVVVSTPGYPRPSGLGTVRNRLAWMLVSTDYTYQYYPYLPGCSVKSWWERHKAECATHQPTQTHTGARFDFIDAVTGAGLVAIATDNHDPTFATTVAAYTKTLPPPPAGAMALDGAQPTLQTNDLIGAPPKNAKPRITAQQAIDAYNNYGPATGQHSKPTVRLVMLYQLLPPAGDTDYQDATWHANLVWLVTSTGLTSMPAGPGQYKPVTNCAGTFPVDAYTGHAYWFQTDCSGPTGGPLIRHK